MTIALCWFRRDLRDTDHAALYHALKENQQVHCVFVFDRAILDPLPAEDRRVSFIWHSVQQLKQALQTRGGDLWVMHDHAQQAIPQLAHRLGVRAVYCNHDYEPAAIARDDAIAQALKTQGVAFKHYKDQVIFEQDEILNQTGKPYGVFTPYKKAWLKNITPFYLQAYPVERYAQHLAKDITPDLPPLTHMGFINTPLKITAGMQGAQTQWQDFIHRLNHYHDLRDYPARKGPSYLSTHLRFGTLSIRSCARFAYQEMLRGDKGADTWLSELIWREFYQMLLWHHPHIVQQAFKPEYNAITFPNDPKLLAAWQTGQTGYPIVDAAMRQLNQTGWMHNRLRMIAASFLVKDLHCNWRLGEAYFAQKLLDYDLAANNGGWQWCASTGCDAQPYFRIFNPITQSERFDPNGDFIRKYVPELRDIPNKWIHAPWLMPNKSEAAYPPYPNPIVDHGTARAITLALYKQPR